MCGFWNSYPWPVAVVLQCGAKPERAIQSLGCAIISGSQQFEVLRGTVDHSLLSLELGEDAPLNVIPLSVPAACLQSHAAL